MKKLIIVLIVSCLWISCTEEPQAGTGTSLGTSAAVSSLNTNINALLTIVHASESGLYIKACMPYKEGNGYALLFSDGSSASFQTSGIVIGKGSEHISETPLVGIRKNDNGYIWTVDGKSTGCSVGINLDVLSFEAKSDGISLYVGSTLLKSYNLHDITIMSYFKEVVSDEEDITVRFADGTSISFDVGTGSSTEPLPGTGTLRRPISAQEPAWIVHIDTWLYPDPQKVIDMIPADVLPYVIFNLSFSVEGMNAGKLTKVEYAYETAKSWIRTCAMNRVWAMIQPASGAYCHFKDTETYEEISESLYAEFYRDYPNFIGFNYCEQHWGFDEEYSVSYQQRLTHWTHLMRLTHEYGGYLIVSCCGPYYAASLNGVAMIKRPEAADFAQMCRNYPENFIICEKFTSKYGFYNNESACLGMWLSGFAGQYGIRYDTCGWTETADRPECPAGAGIIAQLEHLLLTGGTVIDGPELIREECYREAGTGQTSDGYTERRWETFPQFHNISVDIFRKIIDGTIRIPQKQEVIDKSGIIIIQDVNSGDDCARYTAPEGLYKGLYAMDGDGDPSGKIHGNPMDNRTWFKKTGRYPAIPYAAELNGTEARSFKTKVNMSEYNGRWADESQKKAFFDSMFPEEYTGDIYAGRLQNSWVTYNPFKEVRRADGMLTLMLNSCDRIRVSHPNYSAAVIRESRDRLSVYMNNYDISDASLKKDTLEIYGSSSAPTLTYRDRGEHAASRVETSWKDGIYTVTVSHNGPMDLEITCSGKNTGKNMTVTAAPVKIPARPAVYEGDYQFEAENFDYRSISSIVKNGCSADIRNYSGQGYMKFGRANGAAARIIFAQTQMSDCTVNIKYMSQDASISELKVSINGTSQKIRLPKTSSGVWNTVSLSAGLISGQNIIEIKAEKRLEGDIILDNVIIVT